LPFDTEVFRLVIGKPQVVLRGEERVLSLLQMRDRLVDLIDRRLELLAREPVVPRKAFLESVALAGMQ